MKEIICYKVPFYEVVYVYAGQEYRVIGSACGNIETYGEFPKNNINVSAIAEAAAKPYKAAMIVGWVLTPVSFIVASICSGNGIDINWPWTFFPLFFIASIVFTVLKSTVYSKRKKALKEDAATLRKEQINELLKRNGYEPLTEKERARFQA